MKCKKGPSPFTQARRSLAKKKEERKKKNDGGETKFRIVKIPRLARNDRQGEALQLEF